MATKKQTKISTHVEVSGEAKYKQALADCRREVELLKSEQKLIEAQFKNTGDEQQYNANMADLLRRKLDAQRRVIDAAWESMQNLTKKGVDPSSASFDQWRQNLNKAETDFINTQTELNELLKKQHDATAEMSQNGKEAADGYTNPLITGLTRLKGLTDYIGGIGGDMNFTSLNTAINNLQKVIDPNKESDLLNGFKNTASELTAVQQIFRGISGMLGAAISNPTAAAIGAAIVLLANLDDISKALSELERERQFAWVDQLKELEAGISEEGIAAIKNGIQQGIRQGVDEADIANVIGRQVAEGFAAQSYQLATAGYGNMETIGAGVAYTKVYSGQLQSEAKEKRDADTAALLKQIDTEQLAGNTEQADKLQAQLDEVQKEYEATIDKIEADRIKMVNEVATGSMKLLNEGVNADALNEQLENLAVFYDAWKKIEEDASSVFEFDEEDNLIGLSEYAQRLADILGLSLEDFQGTGIFDLYNKRLPEEMNKALSESWDSGGISVLADLFKSWSDAGALSGIDFTEASGALLAAYRASLLKEGAGVDKKLTKEELFSVLGGESFQEAGTMAADGFAGGVTEGTGDADTAGRELADSAITGAMDELDENSPSKVFETIGENVAVGLANGIYERADEAIAAARWLADSVEAVVQEALDIHSPSRVFEELGSFTALGFAEGIESSETAVSRAIDSMIRAVSVLPVMSLGGMPAGGAAGLAGRPGGHNLAGTAGNIKAYVVLDKTIVGEMLAPVVDGYIGAELQARR